MRDMRRLDFVAFCRLAEGHFRQSDTGPFASCATEVLDDRERMMLEV